MKQIDGAPGQPLDARSGNVEAVPDASQIAFGDSGKSVQRKRACGALLGRNRPGHKKRNVKAGIVLNQRVNLPANDAANACCLPHGRRIVDDQLHSPLKVHKRLAAKFQKRTTPMAKSLAEL